jgi:hypothetical protein
VDLAVPEGVLLHAAGVLGRIRVELRFALVTAEGDFLALVSAGDIRTDRAGAHGAGLVRRRGGGDTGDGKSEAEQFLHVLVQVFVEGTGIRRNRPELYSIILRKENLLAIIFYRQTAKKKEAALHLLVQKSLQ